MITAFNLEIKMPISEYIMNTINDIIARYVELHMEAYLKYQRAAAEHQRTFGGKYKKGEKVFLQNFKNFILLC